MPAPAASYPIAGVFYFIAHPQLWLKVICPFLLIVLVGILSLVLSFVFLLPLQAHALIVANCPAWLAWTVSVIFVLLESTVIDLLAFAIITPIYIDILFDKTLKIRGMRRMFDTRAKVHNAVICCRGVTAGVFMLWFLLLAQVSETNFKDKFVDAIADFARFHVSGASLVDNSTIASDSYLWNCGCMLRQRLGSMVSIHTVKIWGHHIHYDLEFRGWSVAESRRYAWKRKSDYAHFGAVAVGLELVPIFNLLFMWTNAVGAALWVADQYEERERITKSQTPSTEGLLSENPYDARSPPTTSASATTLYPDESTYLVHK
ncbi:hypothetical protein INT43_006227 [Umbelopsis isabellina]|uniref:Uncharacterized protein n=1 Tax=Mortierella isabellina TaxID=91625 RepID=A0A8H7Q0P3_MORIS|nr:hypothetical protein INT43_006227 [Umbelopsis isabellina]